MSSNNNNNSSAFVTISTPSPSSTPSNNSSSSSNSGTGTQSLMQTVLPHSSSQTLMGFSDSTASNMMEHKINQPTMVEYQNLRFLIMDAPTDSNLPQYIEALKKKNVSYVVRACESSYSIAPLEKSGIKVLDLPYPDGESPPDSVISQWLSLVDKELGTEEKKCISVHCVAGLGRAPMLVAIALMEAGMAPLDTVAYIRRRRRGAFNAKQLQFVEKYQRRGKGSCCVIC
eukprot:TRINITY_DN128_c0_g2_i1.p1 TRINITY_DN128_c0_g2~~TRINITY_DN128_c0_g2_i1.p1  ORF type:complete len:229 (-),score=48.10 TRINITY_DN128_c0_g2_i1:584-1270(-)